MTQPHVRRILHRSRWRGALIAIVTLACGASAADAKGGSSVAVTNTATVAGTTVRGTITVTNQTSKAVTVTAITDVLEVRYATGTCASLAPGPSDGYCLVATVALVPPGPIAALGSVSVPYSISTCASQVAKYPGAKDMRSVAVVTVAAQSTQARTSNFVPPSQIACPVCGNGVVEAGEPCDGGSCCLSTCRPAANGAACSDQNACTRTDQCQNGSCVGNDPVTCGASDQCHDVGVCNPTTGTCSNPTRPNGTVCDDASACSSGDRCVNGRCAGTPVLCDDGNGCTSDACVAGECVYVANANPCEDGSVCTDADTCLGGECISGPPRDCDDHQTCTDDACEEERACTHTSTPTCESCDAEECVVCQGECDNSQEQCTTSCWDGFMSCLAGCTSTYCAPFCQVDLGGCLAACPDHDTCLSGCESGNGCELGCGPLQ